MKEDIRNLVTEYAIWILLVVVLIITVELDMRFESGLIIGVMLCKIIVSVFEKRLD